MKQTQINVGGKTFTEIEVPPPPFPGEFVMEHRNTVFRTSKPRKLQELPPIMTSVRYDNLVLPTGSQEIEITYREVLFILSPRGYAYIDRGSMKFTGHLHLIAVHDAKDGNPPVAEISISPMNM